MTLVVLASVVLAAVLATAGLAKLRDRAGSREAMAGFGVPPALVAPLALAVPTAELCAAVALVAEPARTWGALGALVLLAGFSLAIAWNLAHGRAPDCHCFGQLHSSPAGPRTLARNSALIALAGLAASQADPAGTALVASAGVAIAAAGWVLSSRNMHADRGAPPADLTVGSPAPSFELPSLEGHTLSLESLLGFGKPALLVFSDPQCGPCQALAPQIAEWQNRHSDQVTIAVIERGVGPVVARRDEHGRRTVLFQAGTEVADSYAAQGTPAAVLVGTDGRVASAIAGGSSAIEDLVAEQVTDVRPHPVEVEAGSAWTVPFRLGGPVIRRALLARAGAAAATTSTILRRPVQALGAPGPRCTRSRDCPKGTKCRSGRCVCPEIAFPDRCRGDCVNFDNDNAACGGCNRSPCPHGTTCSGGKCVTGNSTACAEDCLATYHGLCCNGQCTQNINVDLENCGGCGTVCGRGQVCCNGRCIDPKTDPRYCGGCLVDGGGQKCGPNQVCHGGRCRDECPKPLRQCGRSCGNPNTQVCCGKQVLIDKEDVANGSLKCCGGRALEPTPAGDCPPRCSNDLACFGDERCCDGICVDAGSNPHCGGCNRGPCLGENGCQCGCVNGRLGCFNTVGPGGGPCPDGDAGFIGSPAPPGPGGCPQPSGAKHNR